jgi:N-6 DNA Methylase
VGRVVAMRVKDLVARLSTFRDSRQAARSLVFLHELSAEHTLGQPPREAQWQRIIDLPSEEWGPALDHACDRCLEHWPEQLGGFFGELRFARESASTVKGGVEAITKLFAGADMLGGPWDRRTILAGLGQELRSDADKKAQGAFFTPWNVAEMLARISLETAGPEETWVFDPAVGGAVLLVAALTVIRKAHGREAARATTLIGVDINPYVCETARASLLLAGADPDQFWIFAGDSLAQPVVGRDRSDGQLKTINFSVSLANPPFGGKTSRADLEAHAERGPLVIPDHVLYREIPVLRDSPAAAPAAKVPVKRATRSQAKAA